MNPVPLSNEICDFLKIERNSRLSRLEVKNKVIDYIKDNHLFVTFIKFKLDDKLYQLFGIDDMKMFGLMIDIQSIDFWELDEYLNMHLFEK